ncbi:hypothetical protein EVB55_190 [Rhizobium phage RHph_Y68]|uniref:Uncharacterized protein n=1 Tax=Rhizobium phage RHph_Y68 TaxID=2509787 RepID=A0A7S5R532_9CAUD|nr:hypothetical protein PP934_gp190 [Rhizobium phage RHph_Y68]QIG68125.1 hypothetical protein EVB55_190 [Rhizobium phage RHph_Y68]
MFHVTNSFLPDRVEFEPRIPPKWRKCDTECSHTPRISVAPTIAQCLMGIDGIKSLGWYSDCRYPEKYYVYWIDGVRFHEPIGVPDFDITNEMWVLEKAVGHKIGKVCFKTLVEEAKIVLI